MLLLMAYDQNSGTYKCQFCGQHFEYKSDCKTHQSSCGESKLTDFDFKEFNSEIKRIDAVNRKVSDIENDITDNSEQRTLRNHKVRQNKLNNF